jgi:uncharacterized protein (DUF983 family)
VSVPVSRSVLLSRAIRLKCPQCGESKMFHHWLSMYPTCPHCGLKYEREPGYFLGSIYVNYGLTAMTTTFFYVTLHFGAGVANWWLVPPLLAFCILFPIAFFPYARAYWLAMDLSFDQLNDEPDQPPPGYVAPK